ncbi:endonuclease domain-containing protein [Erythrobacter sp. NE805]|uniref:endonuclease domain-containing protein n=1 Tax=Erythrobacter sp. NE805 TaxID=3389875 RepID=UPI00396B373A
MLKDVSPQPKNGTVRKARKLRKAMSLPEVSLWEQLRKRPAGLKFRRQHPSGPYVLDFFCSDARLAIEIDGEAHDRGDQPQRDSVRDEWFARTGIETLRIPARAVLSDAVAAADGIAAYALARLPLHHPLRGRSPSPNKFGED